MKKILLVAFACLAISCGSKQTYDASPATTTLPTDKGLAIGTITFEGDVPVNEIYRFFYEPTSADKKFRKNNSGKIVFNTPHKTNTGWNGDFGNKKSYLVVIEREAGSYAFNRYTYLNRLGPTGEVSYSNEFAIPFEIKKGAITYFGEINYVDKAVKGSPRIYVADYLQRDLKEFKEKYPNIKWENTENKTPKSGNTGEGTIDFRY